MSSIQFFTEDIQAKFKNKMLVKKWIKQLIASFDFRLGELNIVFCSDAYLLKMNEAYLNHDTFTDIITFDFCEEKIISGDLFISWEMSKENASHYAVSHENELHRLIAHGVLHLIGFKDKNSADQKKMKKAEDQALALLNEIKSHEK